MGFHIVKKENCPWWQRLILYVSAVLIALGLADVDYGSWVRYSWKFQLLNLLLTGGLLLFGLVVGY